MMGLAMLPTFLKVFLLAERRRGLAKRRARLLDLVLRRGHPRTASPVDSAPEQAPERQNRPSAQVYPFKARHRPAPARRPPRALP